jgi:hypothetical protein
MSVTVKIGDQYAVNTLRRIEKLLIARTCECSPDQGVRIGREGNDSECFK